MTFEPYDYISLAYDICDFTPTRGEANGRSAYSRAYYAAFLVARERLRAYVQNEHLDSPGAHGYVLTCLRNSPDTDIRGFAKQLADLERKRRKADYDLAALPHATALAKINAGTAKVWIAEFRALPDDKLRQGIRPPY